MTTETKPETIEELAEQASGYLETAYRGDDPEQPYVRTTDNRPDWLQELVYDAHGDMLPDDWRYSCIRAAVEHIAEGRDESSEFADEQVDVYNGARVAWLASSLTRASYCDDAADEGLVSDDATIYDRIGLGQYMEAQEVYANVYASLDARLDEIS